MIATIFELLPADARRRMVLHLSLTVLSVLLRAAGVVLLVPIVTDLFTPQPERAWPWVGALAAVTVAGWLLDFRIARIGYDVGFGLLDTAQHDVADQLTRTRLTWFGGDNTATARSAIAATGPELVGLIVYLVTPVVSAVLLPVAIALGLLGVAWPLGVMALLFVPILIGVFLAAGRIGRSADRVAEASNLELTERIVEFARTQHALRAARRADPALSQAGAALAAQHAATLRLLGMQIPGQIAFGIASQVALLALAGCTAWLTVGGAVSVPQAIALIVVIVRYLEPATALAELAPGIEPITATLRRIRTVLDAPVDPSGTQQATLNGPPTIELTGVGFSYPGDQEAVLHNFSLSLTAGTSTAIVGPSGSGKSTVLSLIGGLQHPQAGTVRIDGHDLSELESQQRRELISMVFQKPYLFDGTIRDNIAVGRSGATDEDLARVAGLARVDEIVERVPHGWAGTVGEAGATLSGGERQRVSIARALLKPAPVLLIDEATSALDHENETAVVAALTDDPVQRTRVIVAHRLASIAAADRVVFLEAGRIVEDGGVQELLDAGGRFAQFWHDQHAAVGWRLG